MYPVLAEVFIKNTYSPYVLNVKKAYLRARARISSSPEKPRGLEPHGREPTTEAGYGCLKESKGRRKDDDSRKDRKSHE